MTPRSRGRLKSWVATLTPIICTALSVLAVRQSNTAVNENHITAGAVATMQQDASEDAVSLKAALARIAKLEAQMKALKKQRPASHEGRERTGEDSAASPETGGGPGLFGLVGRGLKGIGHFIFGGSG